MKHLPIILLTAIVLAIILMAQPQASIVNGLGRERLDFTVTAGQIAFQTAVSVRSNYVEVYRNGLLQRACAKCDYTGQSVPGAYKITFNELPGEGDYVTLFYYR